jgi:CRP-like cAMP-binding protein
VRRLLRSGKIKGQKWGRDWMISELQYRRKRKICERDGPPKVSNARKKDNEKYGKEDIMNILQETQILKGIIFSKLEELAKISVQLHFHKDQIILREEETLGACYIITKGQVKVYKGSVTGREFIIDILDKGNIFGIGSLISGINYSGGVQAIKDTDILSISKDHFLSFASRNPTVMAKVVHLERSRISDLFSKLINLMTVKANQRIIKTIIDLCQKYGNTLPYTHQEIAEMSGTTNETVTRILVQLKNQGAIELSRGSINIINNSKLSFT